MRVSGNDTPSGQYVVKITLPKAAKITHLSLNLGGTLSSGSLLLILSKNGVSTSQFITLTSGTTDISSVLTSQTFAANDELGLFVVGVSSVYSGGSANVTGTAWGHFTE